MYDKFPLLFLLSGPSGVGKGPVTRELLSHVQNLKKVVTYTTRSSRQNEENGRDYFFISAEEFRHKIENDAIFEYKQVNQDYYYGSPSDIFSQSSVGTDLFLEVDPRGMKLYKGRYPQAVSLWLMPPSISSLLGLDQPQKKEPLKEPAFLNRLRNIEEQLADAARYDYIVKNGFLGSALDQLIAIILAERCRRRKPNILDDLEQELASFHEGQSLESDSAVN